MLPWQVFFKAVLQRPVSQFYHQSVCMQQIVSLACCVRHLVLSWIHKLEMENITFYSSVTLELWYVFVIYWLRGRAAIPYSRKRNIEMWTHYLTLSCRNAIGYDYAQPAIIWYLKDLWILYLNNNRKKKNSKLELSFLYQYCFLFLNYNCTGKYCLSVG